MDFKNEDLYVNSKSNYSKLYQEMAKQQKQIDEGFKPEIAQMKADMLKLASIEKCKKLE